MKILKAIEVLTKYQKDYLTRMEPDFDNAIELGIEALERCGELRKYTKPDTYMPLPGETKD